MFSNFLNILAAILPVFLLIGLGTGLKRMEFIDDYFTSGLNRLVFWVAAPALLFRILAKADLVQAFDAGAVSATVGITVLLTILLYVLAAGVKTEPSRRGVFVQGCFRGNLAFIGLAVIQSAYGERALEPASVMIGFLTPLYNMAAVVVLILPHHDREQGFSIKPVAREIYTNPLVIACAAGGLVGFFDLSIPEFIDRALLLISQIALPLALIGVGSSLNFQGISKYLGLTALTGLVKLLVLPALLYTILLFLGTPVLVFKAAIVLLAVPTAVASYIMAFQMKGDPELAASIITGTTLASIFTLTFWLLVLSGI